MTAFDINLQVSSEQDEDFDDYVQVCVELPRDVSRSELSRVLREIGAAVSEQLSRRFPDNIGIGGVD